MTPDELIALYPRMYHMAVGGSWPKIREFGLLSTQSLLDLFDVQVHLRMRLMTQRRSESVQISHPQYGNAIVRDQKPLIESKLKGALLGGMTLQEWYQVLNERVFFWLTAERLRILLNAKAYKAGQHDVMIVDTARLVRDYEKSIYLAAMNTGNTQPIAHPRGRDTFKTIAEYPIADRRKRRLEAAVELTVLDGVRNIERYVIRVERWKNGELVGEMPL